VDGKKVPLKAFDAKLKDCGVKDGAQIVFKDLGPQIGWQTVFFVEYFGPILAHFVFFQFPSLFYSVPKGFEHGYAQK
jgi:very-long-chain enoyl-CoA reductase